jgi:hypothetical protein
MTSWYVRTNGKVHGPFEAGQLQQMAATGKVSRAMDVSASSNGPWRKAGSVPGLFPGVVAAPPLGGAGRPKDASGVAPRAPSAMGTLGPAGLPPVPPGPAIQPPGSRRGLLIGSVVGGAVLVVAAVALPLAWWLHDQKKIVKQPPRDVAVTEESPVVDSEADGGDGVHDETKEAGEHAGGPGTDGPFVCFSARHVLSHYNLKSEDLKRIQVWIYGEIDAIEVERRQDERTGEVRDGQVVARNADTEVRKPIRIEHLTPGVVTSLAGDDVWVDFGGVEVRFTGVSHPSEEGLFGRKTGEKVMPDEGQGSSGEANAVEDHEWGGFDVRVATPDDEDARRFRSWTCHLTSKPSAAPFLVYRGGSRSDQSKVEEMPEKRATGRTID